MTKSHAQAALEEILLALPQAQGVLGEGAVVGLPAPEIPQVARTGKRGRPKGRPNNKTLMARALAATAGDRLLREANRLAECEPIVEAKRWVALKYNLDEGWDKDPGKLSQYKTEIDGFVDKIVALKKGALPTGLDFQKQKPAKMVDVTERKLVVARVTVASAEQLPAGARHLVDGVAAAAEAAANAVREDKRS